jgi:hypothetical protein
MNDQLSEQSKKRLARARGNIFPKRHPKLWYQIGWWGTLAFGVMAILVPFIRTEWLIPVLMNLGSIVWIWAIFWLLRHEL